LVATKNNDGRSDKVLIESIKKCLEVTLKHLRERSPQSHIEIDLIKFLLVSQNIGQIKKPFDICDPWTEDPQLFEEYEHLRNLIFKQMKFAKPNGHFSITLAPESKMVLERNNNLRAQSSAYALIDKEIIPRLIQLFDKNSIENREFFLEFCHSFLARVARFETQEELAEFFVEQNLNEETISEFKFRVKKTEFLFSVTDNSLLFADVMANILQLNGGLIQLISRAKEANGHVYF
jgi:hypothetical protein